MTTDQEQIMDLKRQLAEQTRRAEVAEAWQKRLTTLLARQTPLPDHQLDISSPAGGHSPQNL